MRSRADARVPVLFVRLGASVGVSRPAGVRAAPMIRVRCWRRRKGGCVRRAPFGFACSQSLSPRATSGWALERGWRHAEKLTTDTLRSVLRQAIETFPLPHPPKSGDPVRDVDDGEGELFAAEPSPVHLEHVLHAAQARSLLRAPARGARLHPPDRPGLRRLWQRRNKGSHQAVEPAADESGDRQRDAAGVDGEHAGACFVCPRRCSEYTPPTRPPTAPALLFGSASRSPSLPSSARPVPGLRAPTGGRSDSCGRAFCSRTRPSAASLRLRAATASR
mmetsp:Transcript_25217/g.72581  ORF Transcript_25217/g.72581 Transcript_25217/m.72581 type:complete len:277 (-) Transcript_25217:586-1416(-)